jgi:hypothetical protein
MPNGLAFEAACASLSGALWAYSALHYSMKLAQGETILIFNGISVCIDSMTRSAGLYHSSLTHHPHSLSMCSQIHSLLSSLPNSGVHLLSLLVLHPSKRNYLLLLFRSVYQQPSSCRHPGNPLNIATLLAGLDYIIDTSKQDLCDTVLQITDELGVDYILEESCNSTTYSGKSQAYQKHELIKCLAPFGVWVTSSDLQVSTLQLPTMFAHTHTHTHTLSLSLFLSLSNRRVP